MARLDRRAWAVAFYAALLGASYVLLAPPDATPSPGLDVPHFDKLVHALTFAALGVLLRLAHPAVPAAWAWVALLAYGIATEALQGLVPGRSPDALDLLVDAAGALTAFAVPRRARAPPPRAPSP